MKWRWTALTGRRPRAVQRKVPLILQQEAVECGAACLAMVLASHGRWIALEALREQCGITRDGTKATNVLKAARQHGLVAKGLQRDAGQLARLPLPLIVFWNFNHFVVVERIDGRGFHLADPAVGNVTLTPAEFARGYTGIALAFEPGPDFAEAGARPSLLAAVAGYLRGYRAGLAFALAAGMALLVPAWLAALFAGRVLDGVLAGGPRAWLLPLAGALFALALLKMLLTYGSRTALARLETGLAATLAARQMGRLLTLPLNFFAQRYAGDVAHRFSLIADLAALLSHTLAPALIGLPTAAIYFVLLLLLDPALAAIAALAAGLALLLLSLSARGSAHAARRSANDGARLQSMTAHGFALVDDFKLSGTESAFTARWAGAQARVIRAEQRTGWRAALLAEGAALILGLAGVAVLAAGALRVIDGALTVGLLLAVQMLLGAFFAPLLGLVGLGSQLQHVRGIVERLDDVQRYAGMEHGAENSAEVATATVTAARAALLRLDGVAFRYSPLTPLVLHDIGLHIERGQRIALVGSSGSGKSTLARLILGLAEPTAGTVTLRGRTPAQWRAAPEQEGDAQPKLAYVEQGAALFEGTVRANLALWDASLTQERLEHAARDAGIDDVVARLPGGYDAWLSEGGRNLSGGERQRLAIARAFACEPDLLVLDEATSALDPDVEAAVMEAVRRRGCACVIVAQRLSSIRDCDAIVVVEQGRIAEAGTHRQLMAARGPYYALVTA